jgi:drug/metabolite transporter (DMT)-like permease
MLFLIVFGSLVAYSSYVYLLSHVRPLLATSYAYVNPIVALALGAVLAGEQLTPIAIVACLVMLAGVVLVTLGKAGK